MRRLSRFKRSPENPAFQLTARDREILHHVHRHRFLRSDHLASVWERSKIGNMDERNLADYFGSKSDLWKSFCLLFFATSRKKRQPFAGLKLRPNLSEGDIFWKQIVGGDTKNFCQKKKFTIRHPTQLRFELPD